MSHVLSVGGELKVIEVPALLRVEHKNLLTNPGFEIWQRGAGPFAPSGGSGLYTADRWYVYESATDPIQVDRESTIIRPGSVYSAKVTTTYNSGGSYLGQNLYFSDGYKFLCGRSDVYASVWIYTTTGTGQLAISADGTGAPVVDESSETAGNWQMVLAGPLTVPSDATYVRFAVNFLVTGTYYVDNAMMWIGDQIQEYLPLPAAEEWARCLRYYEAWGGGASYVGPPENWISCHVASQNTGRGWTFTGIKPVAPTGTKSGTWYVSNCGQPSVGSISRYGAAMMATNATTGNMTYAPNSSDDWVTWEANPS